MKKEASILKLNKSVLPILGYVLIEKGRSIITDLETTYIRKNDYEGKSKVGEIEEYKLHGTACDQNGNYSANEFPMVIEFKPKGQIDIDEENMKDLLNSEQFVENYDMGRSIENVFIGKHIVATDAHIMLFKKVRGYSKSKKKFTELLLPRNAVRLLKVQKVRNCIIEYDKELKYARIEGEKFVIITRLGRGCFPRYEDVIPVNSPHNIYVNRKDLISALSELKPLSNKSTKQIVLTPKKGKLNLYTENLDKSINGTLEIDISGEYKNAERIGFRIPYLLQALKLLKTEIAVLEYSQPNRAMIIDRSVLIMPVMLHF